MNFNINVRINLGGCEKNRELGLAEKGFKLIFCERVCVELSEIIKEGPWKDLNISHLHNPHIIITRGDHKYVVMQ